MSKRMFMLISFIFGIASLASYGQEMKYPPLSAYIMPQEAESSLAKSAAPAAISDRATIKTLTSEGFETVHQGDNGFVCFVMRGFTGAPTFTPVQFRYMSYDPETLAPICLNPQAVKTILPYYELRTKLAIEGRSPEQIAQSIKEANATGKIPKRSEVSFGYMWSADQVLGPAGHWHQHVMVFAPNYDNSMIGGNEPGGHLPAITDDAGTPFSVVVIPVDEKLAVRAAP